MKQAYEKNELFFAIAGIVLYTALSALGSYGNRIAGVGELPRAGLLLGAAIGLLLFVVLTGNAKRYGLNRPERAARLLWFAPLVPLALSNLLYGAALPGSGRDVLYAIVSAVSIAFLEELLFRGFLYRALEPRGADAAAVVSSAVFGLMHLVRLLDGASLPFVLCQTLLAVAVGYLFVALFVESASLLPCIAAHAAFNLCGAFAPEPSLPRLILVTAAQLLLVVAYTVYVKKTR
ncbi:MAG: CPBP family intramembrane metalloprotease [Clostridia bacterium]|nr:CPBP family intramembrane metalloprotease [Clostridia bacterium]